MYYEIYYELYFVKCNKIIRLILLSLKKPSKRRLNYVASIHVSETLYKEK